MIEFTPCAACRRIRGLCASCEFELLERPDKGRKHTHRDLDVLLRLQLDRYVFGQKFGAGSPSQHRIPGEWVLRGRHWVVMAPRWHNESGCHYGARAGGGVRVGPPWSSS